MTKRRSYEQAMTWLNSKAADKDSLDGINAELCINLIEDLRARLDKLGAQFQQMKNSRDKLLDDLESLGNFRIDITEL